jgi:hypothetical protein
LEKSPSIEFLNSGHHSAGKSEAFWGGFWQLPFPDRPVSKVSFRLGKRELKWQQFFFVSILKLLQQW